MVLIAALVSALAVSVAVYVLTNRDRDGYLDARLARLHRKTLSYREAKLATLFFQRVALPIGTWVRAWFVKMLPTTMASGTEDRLVVAGEPMSARAYLTWQAMMAVAALSVLVMGLTAGAEGLTKIGVFLVVIMILATPYLWLRSKVAARQQAVIRALPDAVDLIVTMVEAGQSIEAAIADVAAESDGPLADELQVAMREITLGRSRRDALLRLIERVPVPELTAFVQAVLQAQTSGVPLGDVLRTQAVEIRRKKRQRAEAEAGRAPVKMVLVMVFLIMPSMVLVMLGPTALRMMAITE